MVHQEWVTDQTAQPHRRLRELVAERDRLARSVPPDVANQLTQVRHQQRQVQRDLADLHTAAGRWTATSVAAAYQDLQSARYEHQQAVRQVQDPRLGLLARRRTRHAVEMSGAALELAEAAWSEAVQPLAAQLGRRQDGLTAETSRLEAGVSARRAFLDTQPGIQERIAELDTAIHQAAAAAPAPPVRSRRLPARRLQPGIRSSAATAPQAPAVRRAEISL